MAGKSLDTYISREIIRRYHRLVRERETGSSLYAPLPFSSIHSRIFRTFGRKQNISLGVISRARHAIGGMSFRLRIYQHTPEACNLDLANLQFETARQT